MDIDRGSRKIQPPIPISISYTELEEAVLAATGHNLKFFSRFADGALSIPCIVSIKEGTDIEYVVQLGHYSNITWMNYLMT